MRDRRHLVLVGDVRANTSCLQIFEVYLPCEFERGKRAPGKMLVEHTLYNRQFKDFIAMIGFFLSLCDTGDGMGQTISSSFSSACFAVSGPVDRNGVAISNRSNWILDEKELENHLDISHVRLINDFLSNGYGILTLGRSDYVTLQDAPQNDDAPIAVIGACNGLGQCYLTCKDGKYQAWPSEGGHCEFAPKTDLQIELLQWLKSHHCETNRVSVERVVSRSGLVNCYRFLSEKFPHMRNKEVHSDFLAAEDKVSHIFKHSNTDKLCHKAMEILVSTYGSEAGCAALKLLPYGGVYIAGTIAFKSIHRLQSDTSFMDAYYDKGRVNTLMRQVPVRVVLAEDLVARGAYLVAFRLLIESQPNTKTIEIKKTTFTFICFLTLISSVVSSFFFRKLRN